MLIAEEIAASDLDRYVLLQQFKNSANPDIHEKTTGPEIVDATDGNVRKVQKLSRHKQIDTLMIYDDNRQRVQGELTGLLSDLVED